MESSAPISDQGNARVVDPVSPLNSDSHPVFKIVHGEKKVVYPVLDGWRGISILLVLATHMLPLGPHGVGNLISGPMAMSLFFTLSGFLITTSLLKNPHVPTFLVHRLCRIVPLAVLGGVVGVAIEGSRQPIDYLSHIFFFNNYYTAHTTWLTSHLWSLCVEVHFYLFIALLVALGGRPSLKFLPWICLAITGYRMASGHWLGIRTEERVDEILAGAIVALIHHGEILPGVKRGMKMIWYPILALGLVLTSAPQLPWLNYFRPYLGAALVASTLWYPPKFFSRILSSAFLRYIATISYAVYVVHKFSMLGWLHTATGWDKYLIERPINFLIVLALAHISTFYYERPWTNWGKRITQKYRKPRVADVYSSAPGSMLPEPVAARAAVAVEPTS